MFGILILLLTWVGFFWLGTYWQADKNFKQQQAEIDEQLEKIDSAQVELNQKRSQFGRKMKAEQDALQAERTKLGQKIHDAKQQLQQERNQVIQQIKEARAKAQQELQQANLQLNTTQEACLVMQRKLDGYGDQYLIPSLQLMDEIAEQYSIHRAGEKLKTCRSSMREMIKQGQATDNTNSISKILLDFFNTKAEELINKVKHENYGKLKQELADIYALTEYHASQAHFAARIKKEYYQIRQDELKWASILHTLRIEEREQQRALREQAREDERARKEYERAIKDAQKEETMLQNVMEKARLAMEKASEEQKAKYEQQLAELNIKLKEAEEKNQRALSMAQQTRAGHVYLISNVGSFGENMMKIGMTRRLEPLDRVRELGDASVPFLFDVHAIIYSEDAPALEKQLHREFNHVRVNKVNHRKEFFRVSPLELKAKLAKLGIQAQFTLAAEAAEYRETLRIEAMDKGEQDKLLDSLLAQETLEED